MEGTLYAIIERLQWAGILKSEIPAEAGVLLFEMPILLLKRMLSFMQAKTPALVHYLHKKYTKYQDWAGMFKHWYRTNTDTNNLPWKPKSVE